jgi:hypothetical protein
VKDGFLSWNMGNGVGSIKPYVKEVTKVSHPLQYSFYFVPSLILLHSNRPSTSTTTRSTNSSPASKTQSLTQRTTLTAGFRLASRLKSSFTVSVRPSLPSHITEFRLIPIFSLSAVLEFA